MSLLIMAATAFFFITAVYTAFKLLMALASGGAMVYIWLKGLWLKEPTGVTAGS